MLGKGNPHYKDGQSYALWFSLMRPLILERDNGCVVCGVIEKLHVHHVNEDVTDNTPENLITLCHTHHMIHHKSAETPFPLLGMWAKQASESMTSKWKERTASLRERFSFTIV
jgi:hypothetical protein